ncbi:glycosyltransferase family 9 protein [Luteibacter sp. 22Crub2.1]|uniref:glycosyltransferase family 9 protein n=1 Tax=Luteibacter sp. 22Crub2.1 TaxID=1283288 RepID=UPI0009CB66B3|nr:glycosyltransferase family 9 protein [Luteibacter sp. 22Crub2.1]SKC03832.1 ADP-heptose:LPS heptosyltransferase [Luteibacter sp. 22Crub2.1]
MREQRSTRLGSTIHAYAVTAADPNARVFRSYAPYAPLFAEGSLAVIADPRSTRWLGDFNGPVNGEHVRDTMARAAGLSAPPRLRLGPEVRREAAIVLCPHAAERFKEWPERYWSLLAEALLGSGVPVIVLPAPGRDEMRWPSGVHERQVDLAGMSRVLSTAVAMVGPDSGHIHLADAWETPVVGLYAATSAATYGPYNGARHCVDRHREVYPARQPYDSSVHVHGTPMHAISPDDALAAVNGALNKKSSPSP